MEGEAEMSIKNIKSNLLPTVTDPKDTNLVETLKQVSEEYYYDNKYSEYGPYIGIVLRVEESPAEDDSPAPSSFAAFTDALKDNEIYKTLFGKGFKTTSSDKTSDLLKSSSEKKEEEKT
jgi:hypothetical protein